MTDNLYRLPPDWQIQRVPTVLSETVDWSHDFLGIPKVWRQTRGKGVRVMVLDTGFVPHPDLEIVDAKDFSGSAYGPRDQHGHATWCLGCIGAIAGNDAGVCGIAPDSRLYAGKVLGDNGVGNEQMIAAGLRWAIDLDVDIVSMSLGGPPMSAELHELFRAFVNRPRKFVIAAAGNDGQPNSVNCPGIWPETICVGAVDRAGKLTRFSSRGPRVDVVAPGDKMLSTIPGGYGLMSGTSMATPVVAGVTALCLSKHIADGGKTGLESVDDLRAHLKRTCVDKGTAGRDDEYGFGLIAPEQLLSDIGPPAEQPGPIGGDGVMLFQVDAKIGRFTLYYKAAA